MTPVVEHRGHSDPHNYWGVDWAMEKPTCSVSECDNKVRCIGLCESHYRRYRRWGDPEGGKPDSLERFWSKVDKSGICWVWTGAIGRGGYGNFWYNGKYVNAHRFAFLSEHGDIPEGLEVDHICHNRACVNVDHLRLATPQQNAQYRAGAMQRSKTGIRGVSYLKAKRQWVARTYSGGVDYFVGLFGTVEEADAAVRAKRAELHHFPEFNPTDWAA